LGGFFVSRGTISVRFRLLRRRLTISAPRMAVRSALPWPLRWAIVALVFGFCAAIGLWAFEFGRDIAGLENGSQAELLQLREKVKTLQSDIDDVRDQRDHAQSIANTAGALVASEKASSERLAAQLKQLDDDNRRLRDDLGFFEKLIPASSSEAVAIRGVQAEALDGGKIRWQVLVIQSKKNAPELVGRVEISISGLVGGKPWSSAPPVISVPLKVSQYGRLEGVFDVPPQVGVKAMTAKVMDGSGLRASQTIKL